MPFIWYHDNKRDSAETETRTPNRRANYVVISFQIQGLPTLKWIDGTALGEQTFFNNVCESRDFRIIVTLNVIKWKYPSETRHSVLRRNTLIWEGRQETGANIRWEWFDDFELREKKGKIQIQIEIERIGKKSERGALNRGFSFRGTYGKGRLDKKVSQNLPNAKWSEEDEEEKEEGEDQEEQGRWWWLK